MVEPKKEPDLVDAIIHELKTSLTAIIVSVELLGEQLTPEENSPLGRLIQSINRNAHSINERLSLLSETSELLADNPRFQPEPIVMSALVGNITTQLYPSIQSRKQKLLTEVPESLPKARADRQYLEQILINLVSNASKFTPEHGSITICVRPDGANLVVSVADTGIGIPPDEKTRVFEPYYQGDYGKKALAAYAEKERKQSRGGLGLATAKFLVELHRGKIWLESKTGQGTTFYFTLPTVAVIESSSSR